MTRESVADGLRAITRLWPALVWLGSVGSILLVAYNAVATDAELFEHAHRPRQSATATQYGAHPAYEQSLLDIEADQMAAEQADKDQLDVLVVLMAGQIRMQGGAAAEKRFKRAGEQIVTDYWATRPELRMGFKLAGKLDSAKDTALGLDADEK